MSAWQPCGRRLRECIDDVCRSMGCCAWPSETPAGLDTSGKGGGAADSVSSKVMAAPSPVQSRRETLLMSSDYYGSQAGEIADEGEAEVVTEYAHQMSGGGFHVWNTEPYIEEIYPLADRIKNGLKHGGKVYRRRVIVVEDWAEVTEP